MFKTTDIVLAATLKVLGYSLVEIEKNGNKGTFCFDGIPNEVIVDYDLGKLLVEPSSFNASIKALTTAARR
jgi:hypothetical protein